jgi:hypothetical protein
MRGPERIRMNTQRDILDELSVSRKVVVAGEEVTPRFLVYTPSGNHLMLMPLPSDLGERLESFRLARLYGVEGGDRVHLVYRNQNSQVHHGDIGDAG